MLVIEKENNEATMVGKKNFSDLKVLGEKVTERYHLQKWIADNPCILGEDLLIIQEEFDRFDKTKERLDLLALDKKGKLVVIENKLDDSGKDVTWQALKYVSYCATLKKDEICEIFQEYLDKKRGAEINAIEKIVEFFDGQDYESLGLNPMDNGQRIILTAAKFSAEATSTVLWLRNHGIDISCVKIVPYEDETKLYLVSERLLPVKNIEEYQVRMAEKKEEDIVYSQRDSVLHCFWERALLAFRKKSALSKYYEDVSASTEYWLGFTNGYPAIKFNAVITNNKGARAELSIRIGASESANEELVKALEYEKEELKKEYGEYGEQLQWVRTNYGGIIRISLASCNEKYWDKGLNDEECWDEIIDFLVDNISNLVKVFMPRIDSFWEDYAREYEATKIALKEHMMMMS